MENDERGWKRERNREAKGADGERRGEAEDGGDCDIHTRMRTDFHTCLHTCIMHTHAIMHLHIQ